MARNRKNQSAAIRFGPALKACLICLVIVLCCVGYVWQKKQILELSRQIGKAETRVRDLRAQNERLRQQMATLLTTTALEARVKELNLGLRPPEPAQIVRLTEPPVENMPAERKPPNEAGRTRALATAVIR